MNKNESKYFNTAVKMDKALIELLEKKDFEYILDLMKDNLGEYRSKHFHVHFRKKLLISEHTKLIFLQTF